MVDWGSRYSVRLLTCESEMVFVRDLIACEEWGLSTRTQGTATNDSVLRVLVSFHSSGRGNIEKTSISLKNPLHSIPVQYPTSISSNTTLLGWNLTSPVCWCRTNSQMEKTWEFLLVLTCVRPVLRLGHMDIMKEQKHLGKMLVTDWGRWKDLGRRMIDWRLRGFPAPLVAFVLPCFAFSIAIQIHEFHRVQ